jgi:Iron-sulfur cluster assembly protein
MTDDSSKRNDGPGAAPVRDVIDLGHRPHLDANKALQAREEKPHEPTVAHAKPPSVAEGGTPVAGSTLSEEELDRLSGDIVRALKTVYDPEIPADIYELGLIYKIDVDNDRNVDVQMTLTAPGCPVAGEMPLSRASMTATSISSSIRRGIRAACRTRPSSPSACSSEPDARRRRTHGLALRRKRPLPLARALDGLGDQVVAGGRSR